MSPIMETLLEQEAPTAESVDAFMEAHDFPLVEGSRITFVYRGEAEMVQLMHWIYGLETRNEFERVPGTDLWYLVFDLRREARFEYKLLVREKAGDRLIMDPLNDHVAQDPFGANSVGTTDGYELPDWALEDAEARPGTVQHGVVQSKAFGRRRVHVYLPARYRETRRYPLLVAHDGADYMRFSALKTVLDNLIHRLEIPPMIVAMSDPGDRLREYADDPRHAQHIVNELLPAMEERYPLVDRPGARGLMGASFGAVAALSTAWRHQGVFGNLLLQSGSFAFTDIGRSQRGPAFDPVVTFVNAFRDDPGRPADKLFLSCGIFESLIYENRSLVPLLAASGMSVRFVEARDGHNWENWRDRLREGLSWLFPGPLWMVYE